MSFGHAPRLLSLIKGASRSNVEALKARHPNLTPTDLYAGYMLFRQLGDGRYIAVQDLGEGRGLMVVGTVPNLHFDQAYLFVDIAEAGLAMTRWDGNGTPLGPWRKPSRADLSSCEGVVS